MELFQNFKSAISIDNFNKLAEILCKNVLENKAISDNSMQDGFVIQFIAYHQTLMKSIIYGNEQNIRLCDGTEQLLQISLVWIDANEEKLIKLFEECQK